jgi:multiple antibiotic resistance protein
MIQFTSIDATTVIDLFLLLLIGIGPKIALVPFLKLTAGMEAGAQRRVAEKMLTTAATAALGLVIFGGLLTRLLHFSTGALSIAGGVILLILASEMVLNHDEQQVEKEQLTGREPMQLAVFPLAVPYLLNPAGIVVLVTASAEAATLGFLVVILGELAVVIALDAAVFLWAHRASERLNEERMLVIEKLFGFLLAALAVQLVLNGLSDVGAIHLTDH